MEDKVEYLHDIGLGTNALKINISLKRKTEKLYSSDLKKSLTRGTVMKIERQGTEWEGIYDTKPEK